MKFSRLFSIFVASVFFLASCSDTEYEQLLGTPYESYFHGYCSEWPFSSSGEERPCQIYCFNSSWTITNIPAWLTVSATSGNTDAEIMIKAAPNNEFYSRECVLYIDAVQGTELKRDSVRITQDANSCFVNFENVGEAVTLKSTSTTLEIAISTNVDALTTSFSHDWCKPRLENNNGKYVLIVDVDELTDAMPREAFVSVETEYDYRRYLVFYQYPASAEGISEGDCPYIDLGIPSGTKWALSNISWNSTFPTARGSYYAWAEANEKNEYDIEHYEYVEKYDPYRRVFPNATPIWSYGYIKYCVNHINMPWYQDTYDYSTHYPTSPDKKTVLEDIDNAAKKKWGADWDIPTIEQMNELISTCSWEWTTFYGVNGYKVTGPNGNVIFLPASGMKSGTEVKEDGVTGMYWTKEINDKKNESASCLFFNTSSYSCTQYTRYTGAQIRPVRAQ